MTKQFTAAKAVFAAAGMVVMILDARTAIEGAQSGVALCIQTVIPSLFPFLMLSALLSDTLIGFRSRVFNPICRMLRIPDGSAPLLLAGILGGYPVGAQCISNAFEQGRLSAATAKRLLAFCNNCGPAFIFGMVGGIFREKWTPWALWFIHLISALVVSVLIPAKKEPPIITVRKNEMTIKQAMHRSLRAMANICGWVILFRVMIRFLQVWFLWYLPVELQAAICGILEMTNGCVELCRVGDPSVQFILCAALLGFGGVCVTMRTYSVLHPNIDRRMYFPGKVIQSALSAILAGVIQILINGPDNWMIILPIPAVFATIYGISLRKKQNKCSICDTVGV